MKKQIKSAFRAILGLLIMGMIISCGTNATEGPLPETGNTESRTEASEAVSEAAETSTAASETDTKAVSENVSTKDGAIYPDATYAEDIDDRIAASSTNVYVKTRSTDKKSGDVIDTSIYKLDGSIVKIIAEDHGSEGRIVSEYYYNGDMVSFMKQYKTDIFGIFSSYKEADLGDVEGDYTNEVLSMGDETLKEAKKDKEQTLLYGYAGDEQGGVLKNVTVHIRDLDGKYTDETSTDGDGYYEFNIPQKENTYNLTYEYDNWGSSSLNDVHIVPGTPEYSLGRVFVAPEGNSIHDTDVYLLNATSKPATKLKTGEYLAVLSSDDPSLTMRLVNLDDQSDEDGSQIKFNPSKCKRGSALFVEDSSYLGKDDMAGTIGRTYTTVTIFDKDGIVAAYREPSGRLGTLWKVCEISSTGDLDISGIMFTDSKGWPW